MFWAKASMRIFQTENIADVENGFISLINCFFNFIVCVFFQVDVYSFGVLLCEMCIRELPDPERRDEQVARVMNGVLRGLIRGCLQTELETRPSMEDVISELEQPI